MGSLAELMEDIAQYKREHWYICPECGGMMKPIMVEEGGPVRKPIVRCENCKFTVKAEEAKKTLEHLG
jgi:DNA-directed RNA polymerase subunit M/transcription elongation factor TFIIS